MRHWLDGPRWPWLCRIFGHQMEWRHWYISSGDIMGAAILGCLGWGSNTPRASWHYGGTDSTEGPLCGRCGKVVK